MTLLEEIVYRYWLSNIEGIGSKTVRSLLCAAGSAEAIYRMKEVQINSLLAAPLAGRVITSRRKWNPAQKYEELIKMGIGFYTPDSPEYPERLKAISDRPEGLYVIGRLPSGDRPYAAVIGARECSEYGSRAAEYFARSLSSAGAGIVSGMARGIDCIAQETALRSGGDSFAVLGCGIDICYPQSSRRLYESLKEAGGILSEYPPGTPPKAGLFPARNRIISGLSDLVLVVEAREKSGTLITVDMALEQGREVFAVPGRISDGLSTGCNRLISQGAGIAVSAADVIQELQKLHGASSAAASGSGDSDAAKRPCGRSLTVYCVQNNAGQVQEGTCMTQYENEHAGELNITKRHILNVLSDSPCTRQQLYDRIQEKQDIQAAQLAQELLELCIWNKVVNTGGYYYAIMENI